MITIKLFAAFAEFAGTRELNLQYIDGMTCEDLWKTITEQFPKVASIPPLFAINDEYVPRATALKDNDQILLFPPVSGGSPTYIFDGPLSVDRVLEAVKDENGGGVALFLGRIRRTNEGKTIRHLFYECHVSMAEKKFEEIISEMYSKWPLKKIAIEHRIGQLEVGDIAVIVGVSSEHRKEAIEACRYGIDELKHRVPIWKKEISETGEEWIGACSHEIE
jgi:molybdopterin synthase catalytic subunit/molybdopterin converting factor small subunit